MHELINKFCVEFEENQNIAKSPHFIKMAKQKPFQKNKGNKSSNKPKEKEDNNPKKKKKSGKWQKNVKPEEEEGFEEVSAVEGIDKVGATNFRNLLYARRLRVHNGSRCHIHTAAASVVPPCE